MLFNDNNPKTSGSTISSVKTNRMQDPSWFINDHKTGNNLTVMAQEIREVNANPKTCLDYKAVIGIYAGGSALYECALTCLIQALQGFICLGLVTR